MKNILSSVKAIKNVIRGLTILVAFFMSASAFAAGTAVSTAKLKQPSPEAKSPWSLNLGLESASNLLQGYEREAQTNLETTLGYSFNKSLSFKITTALYKEQTGEGNSGFDNTSLGLGLKSPLSKDIKWINSLTGILPTNRQMQDETSYQGAVRVGTKLAIENLFWGSSTTMGLSLGRNFHEYDMTAEGGFNIRNNATVSLTYSLPLFAKLSLDTAFNYTQGWTYLDDTRSKFYMGADLGWEFTPAISAYIGTSNEGNAFKANGVDSNIEFFNDTSSVVKAGLNVSI